VARAALRTPFGSGAKPSLGPNYCPAPPTGGGGQVGLLLISQYVKPTTLEVTDYYNHFSLLASIEEMFGLQRLAYASVPGLPVFGPAVFNNYAG
jgi:phosphatidylinositol-3-phosphatase